MSLSHRLDKHRVELAQKSFVHTTLVYPTAIAVANPDAIVVAAALERMSFEFFCRVRHERPRPTEHRHA